MRTSAWLWQAGDADVAFAAARGLGDVFLAVPPGGPDDAARRCADRMRAVGIRVDALGGDPGWVDDPAVAVSWMRRAVASGVVRGVHLDVEPWADDGEWRRRPDDMLAGLAAVVSAVRAATPLPVQVDLAPFAARDHAERCREVVAAASGVTLLAFRDSAAGILSWSRPGREVAAAAGRPYRIGVDTLPSTDAGTSFAGRSAGELHRALADVTSALADDRLFAGIAVHDLGGWRALAP